MYDIGTTTTRWKDVYTTGTGSFSNITVGGNITGTGAATLSNGLGVSGALNVAGAATLSNTNVTGAATLSNGLGVSGALNVSGTATYSGPIRPSDHNAYDIGAQGLSFSNAYVINTRSTTVNATNMSATNYVNSAKSISTHYKCGTTPDTTLFDVLGSYFIYDKAKFSTGGLSGSGANKSYIVNVRNFGSGGISFGQGVSDGTTESFTETMFLDNVGNLTNLGSFATSNVTCSGTLSVSGAGTFGGLSNTGSFSTSDAVCSGTLVVEGAATLSNGMNLSGPVRVSGGLSLSNGYGNGQSNGFSTDGTVTALGIGMFAGVCALNAGNFSNVPVGPGGGGYMFWNNMFQSGSKSLLGNNNNYTTTSGKTFIATQKGTGSGGISFGEVSSSNIYTETMAVSSTGVLTTAGNITSQGNTVGFSNWTMKHRTTDNYCTFSYSNGASTTTAGYISTANSNIQMNFTGQHRTFVEGVPASQADAHVGRIVSANANSYVRMSYGIATGADAITVNESLPVVRLSSRAHDPACFGVISGGEDAAERSEAYGNFMSVFEKTKGDTRVYVNSVGEGALWVIDAAGPLASGDYVTTSDVPGYGQRQDGVFLANYTVAKATMDCDFAPAQAPLRAVATQQVAVTSFVEKDTGETLNAEEYGALSAEEKEAYDAVSTVSTENVLDEHGQLTWADVTGPDGEVATAPAYHVRFVKADGTEISEAEFTAMRAAGQPVFAAAFVGCTYHCG